MAVVRNNSKKISELKPRDIITYHQQDSWIPIAQYNCRTDSYTNIALNVSAITAYNIAYTTEALQKYSYMSDNTAWLNLLEVGRTEYEYEATKNVIGKSNIANNLVTYTFSYTVSLLGWQSFIGRSAENSEISYEVTLEPETTDEPITEQK